MAKTKVVELPHIEGIGVAPVRIPEVDRLAESYIKERDKRLAMTPKEVTAKLNLIAALHQNEKKIGRQPDGTLIYRFDEMQITLRPGKDKLKVEDLTVTGEE